MIRIGTSGFSYKDWVGNVYPDGLPERDWLSFYARHFDAVELNVTYYRLPSPRSAAGWVNKTPEGFLFAVKAFQGITHERQNPDFGGFVESLRPISESGKLGCVLAQFPHSFHPVPTNRGYLKRLREGMGDLPTVVEFRDAAWVTEETFAELESNGLGFCCVDEPRLPGLMPPLARATGPVAYVRFHGRNAAKWWDHAQAWERYDYTYSHEQLSEWIPRIRQLGQTSPVTLVFTNNHYRGQAWQAADALGQLLGVSQAAG